MVRLPRRRRRPALWTALALGIVLSSLLEPSAIATALAGATSAGLAVLCSIMQRRGLATSIFLLIAIGCGGGLRYQVATQLFPPEHISHLELDNRQGIVWGVIEEEPVLRDGKTRFVLRTEAVVFDDGGSVGRGGGTPMEGLVLVTVKEISFAGTYGDRVALRGRLRHPPVARNPGAFDYRQFLMQKGIHATLTVRKSEQVVSLEVGVDGAWMTETVILPLRHSIRGAFQAHLSGAPLGLLQGILLGDKHSIPEEVAGRFRHTGLAHALVISGLHVGLVTVFFFTAFKLCRLPDRAACVATVSVLMLYAFVTDLQAPVVRASIMATVVLLGRAMERDGEIYNSLGVAALMILLVWPQSILSLSFQLSFGATLSIVALHRPLIEFFPAQWRREDCWAGKWIIAPLCVSVAAQIGTGPLIAYHFQQFAAISLVANLCVVPLLALVVSLGILAGLCGSLAPVLALPFNACNYLVITGLIHIVDGFAAVPYASVQTPRPDPWFLGLCAVAVMLAARSRQSAVAFKGLVFMVLIATNVVTWRHVLGERPFEIVFLDIGQGDGALLQFPNGKTMLIDAGNRSPYFDYGERVVLPYLRRRGIRRVDVVVASHAHSDHIGGLASVLEQVEEVGHYVDSGQLAESRVARSLRDLVQRRGVRYHRVSSGDSLVGLGGVGALILHPSTTFVDADGHSPAGLNNGSVVVRFDYQGKRVLFTGDAERETDESILAWGERLRSDLLKVSHHGSRTSSTPSFVRGVDPGIAIVSVGAFNKFGHPAAEVMGLYRQRGTRVYRTDRCGAVVVTVAGGGYSVETVIDDGC